GRGVLTAFELAADPLRVAALAEHPDLLLWEEDPDLLVSAGGFDHGGRMEPARIQLTLAGVWLQEVIFSIPPRVFEVRTRTTINELILGMQVFRSEGDLDALARRLERGVRWGFPELFPQVDGVLGWRSPDRAAVLRAWGAGPCPECGKPLLPRVGEVGIALEEPGAKP